MDITSVYLGENEMTLDLNGDTDYLDSNEMDDSRDFNKANELLTRDASGRVDATDTSQIQSWIDAGTYDVRGDVDLDGDVDSTDKTTVQNYTATKGGRTNLSHAEHGNRKGYAGYEFDDTITHESYHVRHRVLNSVLGQYVARGERVEGGSRIARQEYDLFENEDERPIIDQHGPSEWPPWFVPPGYPNPGPPACPGGESFRMSERGCTIRKVCPGYVATLNCSGELDDFIDFLHRAWPCPNGCYCKLRWDCETVTGSTSRRIAGCTFTLTLTLRFCFGNCHESNCPIYP